MTGLWGKTPANHEKRRVIILWRAVKAQRGVAGSRRQRNRCWQHEVETPEDRRVHRRRPRVFEWEEPPAVKNGHDVKRWEAKSKHLTRTPEEKTWADATVYIQIVSQASLLSLRWSFLVNWVPPLTFLLFKYVWNKVFIWLSQHWFDKAGLNHLHLRRVPQTLGVHKFL